MMSQPEAIFLDNPVDALVPGLPDGLSGVFPRTAVPHAHQHIHNQELEERGRRLQDLAKKLLGKTVPQGLVGRPAGLLRREGRVRRLLARRRAPPVSGGAVRLRELPKQPEVDLRGPAPENAPAWPP